MSLMHFRALIHTRRTGMAVRQLCSLSFMAAVAVFWCSSTLAADFELVSAAGASGRTIRLSGLIVSGDLEKLKSAVAGTYGPRLLLNSAGGSYSEALRIADYTLGSGRFVTGIEANAKCYSACAIIFLSGNGAEDGPLYPWRELHKRGALGFHAPYIPELPNRNYSGQELQNAYAAAVKSIRDLLNLARKHNARRGFIPGSLLTEMLTRGPDQLFLVDTVYKAIKTNINVVGYSPPRITFAAMCNACANNDDTGGDPDLEHPPIGDQAEGCDNKRINASGDDAWIKWHSYDTQGYCVVRIRHDWPRNEGMVLILSRATDRPGRPIKPEQFENIDALYLFPPAMLLRDLP